jgi:hypothetical protein
VEEEKDSNNAPSSEHECPTTPTSIRPTIHPNTPTPHAVPSPDLLEDWPRSQTNTLPSQQPQPISEESKFNDPGPYIAPFLSVIIDPRFSGPHTLVALRSLYRLLHRGSIVQLCQDSQEASYPFYTALQPIAMGVLSCRFEQTDAGVDEAVEMAIADLLGLIVQYDGEGVRSLEKVVLEKIRERKRSVRGPQPMSNAKIVVPRLPAQLVLESFHAVYTTRQTFVGHPQNMGHYSPALSNHFEQVLHSMIHVVFGGNDGMHKMKELSSSHVPAAKGIVEFLSSQIFHATRGEGGGQDGRGLCLRLIQSCIKTGWGSIVAKEEEVVRVVEDELCLALLTTGQAVWVEEGMESGVLQPTVEVLSEVCSTLSLLWSIDPLRKRLHSQFVAIFSGFYQRALSLLRKRPVPEDGAAFQSNLVFDAEAEVILESLVDILCLHGGTSSLSTLEELFGTYDCSLTELDVASGLLVELSLCCGGSVDEEGEAMTFSAPMSKTASSGTQTPLSKENGGPGRQIANRYRSVPDYLKELCSQALLGCIKQLCRQSDPIVNENLQSNAAQEGDGENEAALSSISLRRTKERKRVLHHAAKLFNDKPSKGIQYLLDNGILPNPVTPESVSSFLRNGLVVGLDKAAVGQYLGEKGKAPSPDKNPPVWDCEWFHKDVLAAFCSSFAFENQSLLDGLRMFLATFRLPGEAQMIDRILQGFSESCGCSCEESVNGSLKLFSKDEKRASDAAYLLSFSIIMLNTDLVRVRVEIIVSIQFRLFASPTVHHLSTTIT